MASGCKVVASDVGGISEVLDNRCVVPLGNDFVSRFAMCCVTTLAAPHVDQSLIHGLSWKAVGELEYSIIKKVCKHPHRSIITNEILR